MVLAGIRVGAQADTKPTETKPEAKPEATKPETKPEAKPDTKPSSMDSRPVVPAQVSKVFFLHSLLMFLRRCYFPI